MSFVGIIGWVVSGLVGLITLPLSVIFLWDYFSAPEPMRVKNFDYNHQTEEDENGIRRRAFTGKPEEPKINKFPKTMYENFLQGLRISGDRPLYGWRKAPDAPYSWITYSEFAVRVKHFGSGLIHNGFEPNSKTFIGIQAQNCVEWSITEMAVNSYSMVIVPLYETLGVEACNYVVNFMKIPVIVCDTKERFERMLDNTSKLSTLRMLISVAPITDESRKKAESAGIKVALFSDIEQQGKDRPLDAVPPKPTDLCTICCTSGTTGDPKGVMLTHENFMSECESLVRAFLPVVMDADHVVISYLPLAHLLERLVHLVMIFHGASIGFYSGDVRKLTDDIKTLRPTLLPAVPRVLGRIYAEVWKQARKNYLTRAVLHIAYRMKRLEVYRGISRTDSIWDKLVFNKVRAQVGGRLRLALTGSAPIEGEVLTFMRVALGVPIVEGYGQTESTGGATVSAVGDNTAEHVGPPMPGVEIKLVDVKEMDYYAKDGIGEVCIRGKIIMPGYYNLKDKTAETLDKDGWLYTGDVGTWTKNGCLKIVDRKKNLFKLSQGEYIAPEKLEQVFGVSKYVTQVFVDGDSKHSFPVAIVIPDKDNMLKWAGQEGLTSDFEKLLKTKEAQQFILDDFKKIAKKDGIKSFEVPQAVALLSDPFSVANGLLTPTFKAKREAVRKKYAQLISDLYKNTPTS